jgi:hypothetical protein
LLGRWAGTKGLPGSHQKRARLPIDQVGVD